MSSLTSLAESILAYAKRLDEYTSSQNLPPVSFDDDSLGNLPPDLEAVRNTLINSAHNLKLLAQGPVWRTVDTLFNWTDLLCLRVIYEFKLAQAIPIEESATYQKIAEASGVSESLLQRFLRQAIANHIFAEASPGQVRHTAVSRMLVTDPDFYDAVGMFTTELAPSGSKFIEALSKYGDSGEHDKTAYCLIHNTPLPMYQYLSHYPDRERRFGAAMRFFTKGEGWHLKHLVSGFDWASIDRPGAIVVDVGGGNGSVSQALAKATQHVKFIVQDLPSTADQARATQSPEFEGRIEFMGHDFFTKQTVQGADMYLFRWTLHNWSDRYCVQILQNLVPAMKDGGRVLLYEFVLNDEPETKVTERKGQNLDMVMAALFNGAERTKADWLRIFNMIDKRFVFQSMTRPPGSIVSVIELVWRSS